MLTCFIHAYVFVDLLDLEHIYYYFVFFGSKNQDFIKRIAKGNRLHSKGSFFHAYVFIDLLYLDHIYCYFVFFKGKKIRILFKRLQKGTSFIQKDN